MPVLALAIVVEARSLMTRWESGQGAIIKSFLGLSWGLPLLVYTFATPSCLMALTGQEVWSGWTVVIPNAMAMGLGSLVLTPALEILISSNAAALARFAYPLIFLKPTLETVWLKIRSRRTYRKATKLWDSTVRAEIQLRSTRQLAAENGVAQLPEAQPHLLNIEHALKKNEEIRRNAQDVLNDHAASRKKFTASRSAARIKFIKTLEGWLTSLPVERRDTKSEHVNSGSPSRARRQTGHKRVKAPRRIMDRHRRLQSTRTDGERRRK